MPVEALTRNAAEWTFVVMLVSLVVGHYGLRKVRLIWHVRAFLVSLFAFGLFRNTAIYGICLGCLIGLGLLLWQRAILDTLDPRHRKEVRYVSFALAVLGLAARSFWPAAFAFIGAR